MKALKDGKNLTPAQIIHQLTVTPAKGTEKGGKGAGKTSKGKGKGKDDKGGGNPGQDNPWKGAPFWFHNAKHHYPEWGHCCLSKIDEATGKTLCWFPHTIMPQKDFDVMPLPRSTAKGGGKGG